MISYAYRKERKKYAEEKGMYPETQRKYRPTHNGKVNGMYSRDYVKKRFRPKKRNEIWTGDITYIKTVIGYAISKRIDTELVKQALSNAIAKNGTKQGLIFHSEGGTNMQARDIERCWKIMES